MTAKGSPPAAYGESPQWLVQQLLTRSPPFTNGFASTINHRISLEGSLQGLKHNFAMRSRTGRTYQDLRPDKLSLPKKRLESKSDVHALGKIFWLFVKAASILPTPPVLTNRTYCLRWEIVEFCGRQFRFSITTSNLHAGTHGKAGIRR